MALHRAEEDTFGWNHGELSHRLLTHWRVPASIAEACLGHHAPRLAGASREAAILHLADVMAELFEYGSNGARRVPPLEPEYWDLVGLAPASLALVHGRARRQIEDVLAALAC
jgi:hypothetical protein